MKRRTDADKPVGHRKKRSVKLRIWEYFVIFTVCLLLIIWLLQIVFLQVFYREGMMFETLTVSREIVRLYESGGLTEAAVHEKALKNNLFIVITDETGNAIGAYDSIGPMDQTRIRRLNQYAQELGNMQENILSSGNHEVYYRLKRETEPNDMFLYGARCVSESGVVSYLYVIAQLNRIDSVMRVLQQQFAVITVLALLFAFGFAYLMARRFSRPVEQLTKSARELALGNTEVKFETERAFGEIEELSGALQYAADEIAKSSELRRELMANVSHDLRTPLTMIKMYAEMIRDITGDNKEKREKNLKIIMDETDRLTLLVQDILELSKIEATNRTIDISAFDVCKLAQTVLERFSIMREQGYTFELDAPETVYVLGDKARIEQVLYNLLSNAVNYSGEDKRVRVRITPKFDSARVEVIDSGPGIAKEDLANIWDRYYRAKTHVRSQMGTGLGLSIVKSILTAHNANFGIDSTLGVGSDFWFELKLPENAANKTLRLADNSIVSSED